MQGSAVDRDAALALLDEELWWPVGLVGERVGLGPAHDDDAAGREPTGGSPSATTHASPWVKAINVNAARSSTYTDHGGLISDRRTNTPSARGRASRLARASTAAPYDDRWTMQYESCAF